MRTPLMFVILTVCSTLCAGLSVAEATGPPTPVPYTEIPDLPNDAERHIAVKSEDRGPVWLLTGFLHGFHPDIPYETIAALKPTHWRGGWPFWSGPYRPDEIGPTYYAQYLETRMRLQKETGLTWKVLLAYKPGWRPKGPGRVPWAEREEYGEHIRTLVGYCKHMGIPVDYWEAWNEPPSGPYEGVSRGHFWTGTWEEYLGMWDTTYEVVREIDPDAMIVGPSYGSADVKTIEPFLQHCKDKGQRLDVLDWHDAGYREGPNKSYRAPVDQMHRNIEEIRNLVDTKYPMLEVKEYHIAEWGRPIQRTGVGTEIAHFYYMDLAGLHRSGRALWTAGDLCGLLVSPKTPRTTYWAWKAYADGVGVRLVTETNDPSTVAIASRDDAHDTVRVLLARTKRYTVEDEPMNLPPVRMTVDVEGLPIEGEAEVSILRLGPGVGALWEEDLPGLTERKVIPVHDGRLTIVLDNVQENEAYSVTITPQGVWAKEETSGQASPAEEPVVPETRERELHRQATAKATRAAKNGAIRIACGAALAFVDPHGNAWFADREYSDGGFGYVGGGTVHRGPIGIDGTDNPEIYRSELWGMTSYHVTIPNGKYLLRLHWAEAYGLGPGGRTFDVVAEGETILKDFDAAREAGGVKKAVAREVDVKVTDGVLDIEFPRKEDVTPMINAIEVIRE